MSAWIPAALSLTSTLMQSEGTDRASKAAKAAGKATAIEKDFEARQLLQQGGQVVAVSQRQAAEERRRARLVQSRTLAVAAASGGGVSDPTIVNLIARNHGEGVYRASVALYGGAERARLLGLQAQAADYEGAAGLRGAALRADAYSVQGGASLVAGAADLFSKYNAGGLFSTTSDPFGTAGPTSAGNFEFPGMA